MKIDEIWHELETEPSSTLAWTTRHARPEVGYPLLVAFEPATRSRALLLPATRSAIPAKSEWPTCQGLELVALEIASVPHLAIKLRNPECREIFTALAEDVSFRIVDAANASAAVRELISRLKLWQSFLAAGQDGLSVEAQRGLWGELHALLKFLRVSTKQANVIRGWQGNSAASQDFQYPSLAIEVKTTAAKQPQTVRISSERQLDTIGIGQLYLHLIIVDEREVDTDSVSKTQNLPGIINAIRSMISADVNAIMDFNDRLLYAKWLDAHSARYEGRRWAIRQERTYRVVEGFPCLTERALPEGVGDVQYGLSLAACEPFRIDNAELTDLLGNSV